MIKSSQYALFILSRESLADAAFCRDVASALDILEDENVILAYLGPSAGGSTLQTIIGLCPSALTLRSCFTKSPLQWLHEPFQKVCLHLVAVFISGCAPALSYEDTEWSDAPFEGNAGPDSNINPAFVFESDMSSNGDLYNSSAGDLYNTVN